MFIQNTVKRPHGCSELIRFDSSYQLISQNDLLIHGYIRRMDTKLINITQIAVISICNEYLVNVFTINDSINSSKLNVYKLEILVGVGFNGVWLMWL